MAVEAPGDEVHTDCGTTETGEGLWVLPIIYAPLGLQYVWNREELIQKSLDPSVTYLMGNDPHFLHWYPVSSAAFEHVCMCTYCDPTTKFIGHHNFLFFVPKASLSL